MDRRVKYTRAALRQSLLELMEERSISKISVKEICDGADVGRGTFYAHFRDQFDLLRQTEDEIAGEITALLSKKQPGITSIDMLYDIFKCIVRNSDLCKILFSEHGDQEFLRGLMYAYYEQFMDEWLHETGGLGADSVRYIYAFIVNGSVGLIQQWIHDGMRANAEEMADVTIKLIDHGISAYLK